MLKKRVIPVLLYDGKYAVQTTKFHRPVRRLGPIDQYVLNMANRDIDELIILDITATEEGRSINFAQIRRFNEKMFCPVTYGGGIRSIDDITILIKSCGVDKVAIKTNTGLVKQAAHRFGSQAIVHAMDVYPHHSNGCKFVHGMPKSMAPRDYAELIQEQGAGELMLTSMHRQGTMAGYNCTIVKQLTNIMKIPLIANGGCGSVEDMEQAFKAGASAVAASTVFALTGLTPSEASRSLEKMGVGVRVPPAKPAAVPPKMGQGESV